jgi:YVTN family beta-propeller protein
MRSRLACAAAVLAFTAQARAADPLTLVAKIPLGDVGGRIDHMSFDPARRRLIVAELGNDTVGIVDVAARTVVARIPGLRAPQGVLYVPASDVVLVANAGDGSVRAFGGADYAQRGRLDLGRDADNLRLDPTGAAAWVGHGDGALAAIAPATLERRGDVALKAHPEGFQVAGTRAYVNVPDAGEIAVLDLATATQVARWSVPGAHANFPMTLVDGGRRVTAVYRRPAQLVMFDAADGKVVARLPTCGDADDVFFDTRRGRLYVSCGEGAVAVLARNGDVLAELARIKTQSGARTSYFDTAGDRLYVAARARIGAPAAIWEFQPE